eukprot:Phypoly_transcript_06089.p1 GENE.Phypoly_transcript_06089~~Phypoly_transcript_06089.p1  ORF type:complete len:600 (+),score=105.67 Phypoly_transcript_06089:248-1801(+)
MEHCNGGNLFDYLLNHDFHASSPSRTISNRSSASLSSPSHSPNPSPRASSATSFSSSGPSLSRLLSPSVPSSAALSPSDSVSSLSSSPGSDVLGNLSIVEKEYLPRDFVIEWMRQLCSGVQAIHNAKIVHRDLKSENVFIANNNVLKIGDFGLATLHKNEKVKGIAGTYYYSSPELLRDKVYDRSGDIFSLGCIFYEMATLSLLPATQTCFGDQILKKTFSTEKFLSDFPEDMKDIGALVLKMLNEEPSMRPHVDAILNDTIFSSTIDDHPSIAIEKYLPAGAHKGGFTIRQLLLADGDAFAEVMARAYAKDPLFGYVVHKETNREEVLKAIFKPLCKRVVHTETNEEKVLKEIFKVAYKTFQTKRFLVWGYFNKNKKLVAASVWVPPDRDERRPSFSAILHIAFSSRAVLAVGLRAIRRFRRNAERIHEVAKDKECWHLMYCGVDPDFQNRQIGEALCKPITQWADQGGTYITACVFNERPFHFLQKLGFEVQKMQKGVDKELPLWYFKRTPAGER